MISDSEYQSYLAKQELHDLEIDYRPIYKSDLLIISIPIANAIGLKEACLVSIFENLCKYGQKLEAKALFQDNNWWTRISYTELSEYYPFLGSANVIRNLILKLEKQGYLISDNFSFPKVDRTKWYRLNTVTIDNISQQNH